MFITLVMSGVICICFSLSIFFFKGTASTEIYTYRHTLSLHDALPIYSHSTVARPSSACSLSVQTSRAAVRVAAWCPRRPPVAGWAGRGRRGWGRSEEHTSELQSLMRISYAVFCLKKKKKTDKSEQDHHEHRRQQNEQTTQENES